MMLIKSGVLDSYNSMLHIFRYIFYRHMDPVALSLIDLLYLVSLCIIDKTCILPRTDIYLRNVRSICHDPAVNARSQTQTETACGQKAEKYSLYPQNNFLSSSKPRLLRQLVQLPTNTFLPVMLI